MRGNWSSICVGSSEISGLRVVAYLSREFALWVDVFVTVPTRAFGSEGEIS